MDARTRLLLEGPVSSTILRLSLPNVIVMLVQTSIGLIETYFVAKLGLDALAGMALVFPLYMLLQMVTAGAIGGAILSAVARALGSGHRYRANELVWYAVAVTIVLGALTTVATLLFAPRLYALMGGRDGSLTAATTYSAVVFAGTILVVAFQFIRRGYPRHRQYVFPRGCHDGRCGLPYPIVARAHLRPRAVPTTRHRRRRSSSRALLCDWLRDLRDLHLVWSGCAQSVSDSAEARLGPDARHSSGRCRLVRGEPVDQYRHRNRDRTCGFGWSRRRRRLRHRRAIGISACTVSVRPGYTSSGNGRHVHRGRPPGASLASAWTGAVIAGGLTEAIGLAAAFFPSAWLSLFGSDPNMIAVGSTYLQIVGPFYGFFGGGLALYFASQGAGRVGWAMMVAVLRVVIASGGGWFAVIALSNSNGLFVALAAALVVYGLANAAAVAGGAWFNRVQGPALAAAQPG